MAPPQFIVLMRHAAYQQAADTPSAWQPWPLTAAGFEQCRDGAAALHEMLSGHDVRLSQTIHSSSLLRARQTARAVWQHMYPEKHYRLCTTDALAERSVGAAANLTLTEIEQALRTDPDLDAPPRHWKRNPDYRLPLPGAESLVQAGERVAAHIETLQSAPGEALLVVGHGASMRHAAVSLGLFSRDVASSLSMFYAMPVMLCREGRRWRHVAGDWKQRNASDAID